MFLQIYNVLTYNVIRKAVNGEEQVYTYPQSGWKDQLHQRSYKDAIGQEVIETFAYDGLGNPTVYRNKVLSWQCRRLKQYGSVTFTYDANGVRTSKTSNGILTKYIYDGNNLVAEQRNGSWIYYIYGAEGIAGFNNGFTYLFRKNLQGDVTHIYKQLPDNTYEQVAQYSYDAWGNCKILQDVDGIATLNPFRYRSYYFDEETNLYYLQTRYYDPELCRFISADSIEYLDPETLGGLNLYAYCGNNPVMAIDPNGNKIEWWQWLIAGVVTVVSFTFAVATFGVGIAVSATIAGAAVGALYGYSLAKATGQDVGECIGVGILSGIALGNIATGTIGLVMNFSVSGAAAVVINLIPSAIIGGGAEILSQISADNRVTNWGKVGISALQWGVLNTANLALGAIPETTIATTLIGGYIFNHITGVIGFIVDLIKNGVFNKKGKYGYAK